MIRKVVLAVSGLALAGTAVLAAQHAGPMAGAIKARQAQMQVMAFNLGILGNMAQGKAEYDAEAAQAAAGNMAALASVSFAAYFPEGSDNASVEGTKALPAIWSDSAGVEARLADLRSATAALDAAAGNGLEALQGAMGALGGACGGCHKAYRQENQ